jgi:hypothetical protein
MADDTPKKPWVPYEDRPKNPFTPPPAAPKPAYVAPPGGSSKKTSSGGSSTSIVWAGIVAISIVVLTAAAGFYLAVDQLNAYMENALSSDPNYAYMKNSMLGILIFMAGMFLAVIVGLAMLLHLVNTRSG